MRQAPPGGRLDRLDPTRTAQIERDSAGGYDYRRESAASFDDAIESVEAALGRHGFTIRIMHDIQATLASKGFRIKPIRIYEVDGPSDPAAS
jgi:uncharacterized protein (DUF302 family)